MSGMAKNGGLTDCWKIFEVDEFQNFHPSGEDPFRAWHGALAGTW